MVDETVKLIWKGMSVHVPPEFPLPLGENIKRFAPLWRVTESADDYTAIASEPLRATLTSGVRDINAECRGEYGKNLESIRGIGTFIKKIANFSKRRDVPEKLLRNDCEATLTYGALPVEINNKYDIHYGTAPENKSTVVAITCKFNTFVDRYKFDLSRMMIFKT
jgi:hypothetical protein